MQRSSIKADMNSGIPSSVDGKRSRNSADRKSSNRRVLIVVFLSLVIDLLAFTVILPLFPSLMEYYDKRDDQGSLYQGLKQFVHGFLAWVGAPDTPRWNSVLFGGILGSLFSFLQYLTSPLIGAVSDVYGRKPLMILTSIGIAASYALWAVSHHFTIFVLARVVGGISKGNIGLSAAIVTDVTPPENRGKGMAMIGVAFSVGFLLGPLIGAAFSLQAKGQEGEFFVTPALYALTLAVLDVLFLVVFLKETLPREKRALSLGSGFRKAVSLIHPGMLFNFSAVKGVNEKDMKGMKSIGLVYFLYLFFYSGLEFTLTFLTHSRFDYNSMQQGKMFFVIGIIMILVQGGGIRRVKRGRELSFAVKGLVILIPSFVIIAFSYHQMALYTGLVLFAFASATVVPCLTTEISTYASDDQKGAVMGIFRSLGALARSFGPVFSSTVYWCAGPVLCYIIGSIALVLPLVLLRRIKSHVD